MKKLFTILALISCMAVISTSCTEEEVKPKTEADGAGGGSSSEGKP